MLSVEWIKCGDGQNWCSLEAVNLSDVTGHGVYIIWHAGDPSQVVRIGQGDIADRLAKHRIDPEITVYAGRGTLLATWASVSVAQLDGVEKYLAHQWNPLVGDAFPNVAPIAVNSPW